MAKLAPPQFQNLTLTPARVNSLAIQSGGRQLESARRSESLFIASRYAKTLFGAML